MNEVNETDRTEELWKWVDDEKQLDRKVRRIGYAAWIGTSVAVAAYGVTVLVRVAVLIRGLARNDVEPGLQVQVVLDAFLPLILVLGAISLLVAALSTIAMFLRFRTASLADIQARLAAMEAVLVQESQQS